LTRKIHNLAESAGVDLRFIDARVGHSRGTDAQNRKTYSLGDVYRTADLVTYPSLYEGFGNAFLEAVYFRKPIVVKRYSIFITDIEPKGLQIIPVDIFPTSDVLEQVKRVINDADYRNKMVELYAEHAPQCLARIVALVDRYRTVVPIDQQPLWNEKNVILITYGDQLSELGNTRLAALQQFIRTHQLDTLFSTLHILPLFPYSSDDGFAVTDYRQVDRAVGSWHDIGMLGQSFDLMFDLVLNHYSCPPWVNTSYASRYSRQRVPSWYT
jgi:hypothetical protein